MHDDWPTLTRHLITEFPDVDAEQVVRQLTRARGAVMDFGLPLSEQLEMAEVLARQQLMLLTGELPDAARLHPEVHVRALRPPR